MFTFPSLSSLSNMISKSKEIIFSVLRIEMKLLALVLNSNLFNALVKLKAISL